MHFFFCLFISYLLDMIQDKSAEKHKLAHLWGCTWLAPPVNKLQASQSILSFLEALKSGKPVVEKFRMTRLFNRPSINWPSMETSQRHWVVLFCFFFWGWKNQTVGWFCAPSALTSAARHTTVAFPLPYEKESALGCKKRINPQCAQSRLEYPRHRPTLLCVFKKRHGHKEIY